MSTQTRKPAMPLDKTPLPGAVMPMEEEEKIAMRANDNKPARPTHDMVDDGDMDQTIPI